MSEEKFTQGEWDYFISDNGDGFPIIFVGDIDIAEIYLPKGNGEEMLANAQLIKTAPKMYNMLKWLCFEKSVSRCKYKPESCKDCPIKKVLEKVKFENE